MKIIMYAKHTDGAEIELTFKATKGVSASEAVGCARQRYFTHPDDWEISDAFIEDDTTKEQRDEVQ